MRITIKQKENNEWSEHSLESEQVEPSHFKQFIGTKTVCEADGGTFKVYAIGQQGLIGKWAENKAVMDMEHFIDYLAYKNMEHAIGIFTAEPKAKEIMAVVKTRNVDTQILTQETLNI